MQTISEEKVLELDINKSKFISFSFYVQDTEEILEKLNYVKTLHPKATHVCYGYQTIALQKSYDDGEPAMTAGVPILNSIIKNDLFNTLIVVVRYFGGIKLGAGGLARAYGKAAGLVIKDSGVAQLLCYNKFNFIATYEDYNNLIVNNNLIVENCDFKENVEGELLLQEESEMKEKLQKELLEFKKINSVFKRLK